MDRKLTVFAETQLANIKNEAEKDTRWGRERAESTESLQNKQIRKRLSTIYTHIL